MLLPAERRYVLEGSFLCYLASQGWIGTVEFPGIPMPPRLFYLFPPAPLRPLLYLKDMLSALAHSCIFLEIKLTRANVPCAIQSGQLPTQHSVMTSLCGAKRLYSSLDRYHAHIMHAHTYPDMHTRACTCRHTTRACAFSKPDFPVGWSVIGRLFKGKVWAKKILAVRLPW